MKKYIFTAIMALTLLSLTGCGTKTFKSENLGIEVTVPESGWKKAVDDSNSFVISKDSDMISYTSVDLPEGYKMPTTEEELAELNGAEVMAVSEISDFNYETNEDGSVQSLYYKQTLTVGNSSSILINSFKIEDNKLTSATATLTNADDDIIAEIENIIKGSETE